MRFEDERFVKFYTRDTVGWLALPWQSRALLALVLRKLDRSGCLDLGEHGPLGLGVLVALPTEVVEVGLAGALASGTLEQHGTVLVWPRFLEAQEAVASNAARARASRERARDVARYGTVTKRDGSVTKRDGDDSDTHSDDAHAPRDARSSLDPPGVTKRDASVTKRDCTVTGRDGSVTQMPSRARTRAETRLDKTRLDKTNNPPNPPAGGKPEVARSRGTRLPENWEPGSKTIAWAKAEGIVRPLAPLDEFRDYWHAQPGQRGTKTDWDATYRNWLRKLIERGSIELAEVSTARPDPEPVGPFVPPPPGFLDRVRRIGASTFDWDQQRDVGIDFAAMKARKANDL